MCRNPFSVQGVDINKGTRVYDSDLLPYEPIWYGVIVLRAPHIDEAVVVYEQFTTIFDLEAFCPQRLQGRFVNGYEPLLAGKRQALHPPLVMEHHLLSNGCVKFFNGEELTVTEWSVYVMVGKFNVVFNQSFVFRFA